MNRELFLYITHFFCNVLHLVERGESSGCKNHQVFLKTCESCNLFLVFCNTFLLLQADLYG